MDTKSKALSESVLRRLTNDAVTTFLGESVSYQSVARPGLQLALSNESVADMNMLIVGAGADCDHFREMVNLCLVKQLPFISMIFPEAGEVFDNIADELGLIYATDFPIMVRDDLPLEASGNPDVNVICASSTLDADTSADVLASAYNMPKDSLLRTFPASLFDTTGADVFIARINDETVGLITVILVVSGQWRRMRHANGMELVLNFSLQL